MKYSENTVVEAFKIYSKLTLSGFCNLNEHDIYIMDDKVRNLVDIFSNENNCTTIHSGENLLLIPITMTSPFHITNEKLKLEYLPKNSLNADIYLMYFSIICFYGLFFDSYNTTEPILDFTSISAWLAEINGQIESLAAHDDEVLSYMENDLNYNWKLLIEKWNSIDDTNERVKNQDARTKSRVSFLNSVKSFMIDQDLVIDIGNGELEITEKSKDVISKYFMDAEYNRGILEILYGDSKEEA
ncbi:MAG: DUF6063 family protein [Acidaminobacteraceae bacterium]